MGNSANSTIIYGCPLGEFENDIQYEDFHDDPDIWLAKHQGLLEPKSSFDSDKDQWSAYWSSERSLPLTIEYGGDSMGGYGEHYLAFRKASLRGEWSEETKIPIDHIKSPPPEWDVIFNEFFKTAGMPFQQPDWYLIVSYG